MKKNALLNKGRTFFVISSLIARLEMAIRTSRLSAHKAKPEAQIEAIRYSAAATHKDHWVLSDQGDYYLTFASNEKHTRIVAFPERIYN